jgi:NTE family protein
MKQKVSLVLSGGGARGMAHIGVIEELEKEGYEISSIAGTSMGAVVGGIYALGKLEEYKNWLYTLDKMKIFGLVDFAFSVEGFVKGDKLFNTVKKFVPDTNIEDLRIPFAAVAADIINKKEVVFTSGSVFDAVRASMAIPTVLTPVKTENGLLVDGGIINNLPLNHVKRTPHDILIAVNVNADIPISETPFETKDVEAKQSIYQKKLIEIYHQFKKVKPLSREEKLGYFDVINKTLNLVAHHITQMSLEKYSPDIIIDVSRDTCGAFDFHKAEEMVEVGRNAAIKSLEAYKLNKNKTLDKHLG